jgi:hypothetical protein
MMLPRTPLQMLKLAEVYGHVAEIALHEFRQKISWTFVTNQKEMWPANG